MLDIYWSIEYVMSQSILSGENHEPCLVHLFLQIHHIVYIIPHDQLLFFDNSLFHSILFFILSYLLYPWWSSSFEVDLPLFEAISFVMMSLTLEASDSCLLNCYHLFFKTSLILLFMQEVFHDLSYNSNALVAWLELFHKTTNSYASCNCLDNTTFIHISHKLSRCLPSLP